ncbi:MAG: hypothetical protein ACH346_03150 [Chthoniobacterales bacterium]
MQPKDREQVITFCVDVYHRSLLRYAADEDVEKIAEQIPDRHAPLLVKLAS